MTTNIACGENNIFRWTNPMLGQKQNNTHTLHPKEYNHLRITSISLQNTVIFSINNFGVDLLPMSKTMLITVKMTKSKVRRKSISHKR